MTSAKRQRALSYPGTSGVADGADDLRRMVLLLETADVLERRARRTTDPVQVDVLLRRAQQRRQEAQTLREHLAARGAALSSQQAAVLRPPVHPGSLRS